MESNLSRLPGDAALDSGLLWSQVVDSFVEPEIERRRAAGLFAEDDTVFRFMVLMPPTGGPDVLLNHEVHGVVEAKPLRDFEEGDEVTIGDLGPVSNFVPELPEPGMAYLAGLLTSTGWTLSFQLGGPPHPDAAPTFELGQSYAAVARSACAAGHVAAGLDNAFSAVELFAKAELLLAPHPISLRIAINRKHKGIHEPFADWAELGNVPSDFSRLLGRLAQLRSAARYRNRDLDSELKPGEADELLVRLASMEEHVGAGVEGKAGTERSYKVWATRDIRAGELVTADSFTVRRNERNKSIASKD